MSKTYQTEYKGKTIHVYSYTVRTQTVQNASANYVTDRTEKVWDARFADGQGLGLGASSRKQALAMAQRIIDRQ